VKSKHIEFEGGDGAQLAAAIDRPDQGEPQAHALFAHCFTCGKSVKAAVNIAKGLTAKGIAVLRFDFTGLGESGGDFSDTTFSSNIDDLVTASEYMEAELEAPRILIGHSLGGAAVVHAASRIPSSKAVVTVAAPYDPGHVAHLLEDSRDEIVEKGEAKVSIGGRPFTIKKQFLDDLERDDHDDIIANLDRALLVMHSPIDNIVGIDNAAHLFQAAKHPKSFISLDPADHLLSKAEDAKYAGRIIAEWAERYI